MPSLIRKQQHAYEGHVYNYSCGNVWTLPFKKRLRYYAVPANINQEGQVDLWTGKRNKSGTDFNLDLGNQENITGLEDYENPQNSLQIKKELFQVFVFL